MTEAHKIAENTARRRAASEIDAEIGDLARPPERHPMKSRVRHVTVLRYRRARTRARRQASCPAGLSVLSGSLRDAALRTTATQDRSIIRASRSPDGGTSQSTRP